MGHNATLATTCLTSPRGCSLPPRAPQPKNTNTNNGSRGEPEGSNSENKSRLNVHTRTQNPGFERHFDDALLLGHRPISRLFEHAVFSICILICRMMNDLSSHVFIYVLTHVFAYVDQMNDSWISEGLSAKHTSDGAQRDTSDDLPHFLPRLLTSSRAPQPTNTNTNNGSRGEPEGSKSGNRS